jgi:tyrosyl-tRNA synthetase
MGGSDQLFNLLVGRHLMREHGIEAQVVMTLPLLEGLDGVEKMSKSLGNYVAVEDSPFDMFGKLMSVSDELMWRYWVLLTDRTQEEIDALRDQVETGGRHPLDVKKELARTMVAEFHSPEDATTAQEEFERVFSARELPQEIPTAEVDADGAAMLLSKVLVEAGLAGSNSEARRLIQQGGVRIDGTQVRDPKHDLPVVAGGGPLIQVGRRRFARVRFRVA